MQDAQSPTPSMIPTVLIVDDDEHLSGTLELWFRRQNVHVEKASDGQRAYQFLRECPRVDIVLTDFMMPNLNGIELLRLLKANVQLFDTKVLVMSNNSNFEFRKRAIEMGAVDYVLKEIGARSIVEKAMSVAGIAPVPAPLPKEGGSFSSVEPGHGSENAKLSEIRIFSESILDFLRVAKEVERMPQAAVIALESAERMAVEIRKRAFPSGPAETGFPG